MKENEWRSLIVKELAPLLAFPVETGGVRSGIPDICCLCGWIELKLADTTVGYDGNVLRVDVGNAQRIWMKNWRTSGGPGWFLTRVQIERLRDSSYWMLHDGAWGAEYLGRVSKKKALDAALVVTSSHVPEYSRLYKAMTTITKKEIKT